MRPNTKVIVINFPHSPTGAQLAPDQFARLVAIAELHGAKLLSDEVYRLLEHGASRLPTAAESSELGVSLGVMSKAFGMAGVRIGWIATRDRALHARLAALKDYTTICSSAPSEVLSLIALRARDHVVGRVNSILCSNLAVLDDFFRKHDDRFMWVRPRAGTVAFPKLTDGNVDEFAARLVEREGVLILPGSLFGYPGNHFRLGFGRLDMPEALERLERFVVST
jgi:aspartate/methionine/tyrosine aminotransferase